MNETKILEYIRQKIDFSFIENFMATKKNPGITAKEIEDQFGIHRSNASAVLNQLAKKNILLKIEGRPVYFLPVDIINNYTGDAIPKHSYQPEEFWQLLHFGKNEEEPEDNPFDLLVGNKTSLSNQVEQAKAAILYPPNGLHTLIIGESGTGKTLFARAMHNYGLKFLNKTIQEYPYVEFNCADYFHNPNLLMSHLFGYVKGAFTGAEQEKEGLIQKADGGILFLDEIHRLPPEGQELLFYLIDTGHYRKLGESNNTRKAKILIIAATTEDPSDVLLKTFIRRIPLIVSLPAFRERSLGEKIKVIEHLFSLESTTTQKTFVINPPVIKALAAYDYPGNIGQLASEIKVLCARTFLHEKKNMDELFIDLEHLSPDIKDNFTNLNAMASGFSEQYESDIIIMPSKNIKYAPKGMFNKKTYENIIKQIEEYTEKGFSKGKINEALQTEVEKYYSGVLKKFYYKNINIEEMYKVIEKEIVDFTIEIMQETYKELNVEISQKNILVMAFHIKFLLERHKTSKIITQKEIKDIEKEYSKEMKLAEQIVQRLETNFHTYLPKEEKYFIAILLANINMQTTHEGPGLFIIAHGESTASSMANVCNRLMNCNFVRSIDAPLEQSVSDTYQNVLKEIKRVDPQKGAILLVDMGSLVHFGTKITKETGIQTRTIANVTTLMALDITRTMLYKEIDIDTIYKEYTTKNKTNPISVKQNAIIAMCASGAGTSEAFKSIIEEELEKIDLQNIVVVAVNYNDMQNGSERFKKIESDYNIIACVGNINCKSQYPFFHIAKLIAPEEKQNFVKFISGMALANTGGQTTNKNSIHAECKHFLSKSVTFINPEVAVKYADRYLEAINVEKINENDALKVSLILHIGYMLERNICGNKVIFDNEEHYLAENQTIFGILKKHLYILEEAFNVTINDSEICYMIQTIKH